jgi:hypothetical protein
VGTNAATATMDCFDVSLVFYCCSETLQICYVCCGFGCVSRMAWFTYTNGTPHCATEQDEDTLQETLFGLPQFYNLFPYLTPIMFCYRCFDARNTNGPKPPKISALSLSS